MRTEIQHQLDEHPRGDDDAKTGQKAAEGMGGEHCLPPWERSVCSARRRTAGLALGGIGSEGGSLARPGERRPRNPGSLPRWRASSRQARAPGGQEGNTGDVGQPHLVQACTRRTEAGRPRLGGSTRTTVSELTPPFVAKGEPRKVVLRLKASVSPCA